ncbi:UPF0149 family protein [Kozakia baliensis]|nr:UPF0149 family protein [Kozakia baliensis]GBR29379.1 putative metal-binding protein [Kozakia baliensis NRIC 0488]GEL65754.1 hypothetical protein KBA01_30400 [Kozakia baliensis]
MRSMPPQTKLPPYLRQLERVLARLETAMLLSELDGFLAGVVVCPEMILPSEWLPVALDPDEEGDLVLEHENDARLILRHYNTVLRDLDRGRYAPLFDIDTRHGEVLWELWIEGFERAMALRPEAWDSFLLDPDEAVLRALVGLRKLVAMTDAPPDSSDELGALLTQTAPDIIPDWVQTLHAERLSNDMDQFSNAPAQSTKVGRNEPCPCGSGKKYKKCCGMN